MELGPEALIISTKNLKKGKNGPYGILAGDMVEVMAAIETDSDLSLALYRQAEQLLIDEAACIPFFYGRNYILVRYYVKGYTLNPLGMPDLTKVTIKNN